VSRITFQPADFGRTRTIAAAALAETVAETRPLNLNRRIPLDHLIAWAMIEVQFCSLDAITLYGGNEVRSDIHPEKPLTVLFHFYY
jgi:hypothetical protein